MRRFSVLQKKHHGQEKNHKNGNFWIQARTSCHHRPIATSHPTPITTRHPFQKDHLQTNLIKLSLIFITSKMLKHQIQFLQQPAASPITTKHVQSSQLPSLKLKWLPMTLQSQLLGMSLLRITILWKLSLEEINPREFPY